MKPLISDPVTDLNSYLPQVVKRFDFARPSFTVGRSAFGTEEDTDIYDGTAVTSFGYFRVARHIPTGTFLLLSSKLPSNLRGARQGDNGPILATAEGLQKSYVVAAYRGSVDGDDTYKIASRLRRAMHHYGDSVSERCEKHFTLYGANLTNPENSRIFNTDTPTEVWTNGRIAYLIDQTPKGRWKVTFYAPTRRKDGSFVPVTLGKNKLADRFARVSRVISDTTKYERAREDMGIHWQKVSSRLWDEESLYSGEGVILNTYRQLAQMLDKVTESGLRLAFVTSSVGATLGALNPKYGVIGGLTAAVIHTLMDQIADESYVTSHEAIRKTREARRRLDIDSYPFNEDVSDHFKIQNRKNIAKLSAKLDLDRFRAGEFEFLDSSRCGLLRDHESVVDGFRPGSIREHVTTMHQRGFSSSCFLPDKHTRLDLFQSGLVRLMHEMEDGTVRIYSGYREDVCVEESLRLSPQYIDKLKNGIWSMEYDRNHDTFNAAFKSRKVTSGEMIRELTPLLFRDQPDVSDTIRQQSVRSINDVFSECVGEVIQLRGKQTHTPSLPDLRAILSGPNLGG